MGLIFLGRAVAPFIFLAHILRWACYAWAGCLCLPPLDLYVGALAPRVMVFAGGAFGG